MFNLLQKITFVLYRVILYCIDNQCNKLQYHRIKVTVPSWGLLKSSLSTDTLPLISNR